MFKNVASQKLVMFAFDVTTGLPKTGDAANITPYVSKDGGTVTVLGTVTATEMDATNAKGLYSFVLAQAETNASILAFSAKSSTANVSLVPQIVATQAGNFNGTASAGSSTGITLVGPPSSLTVVARDLIRLTSGTGSGQAAWVSAYNSGSGVVTIVGTWPIANPDSTTTWEVLKISGGVPATPADVYAALPQDAAGNIKANVMGVNTEPFTGNTKPYTVAT